MIFCFVAVCSVVDSFHRYSLLSSRPPPRSLSSSSALLSSPLLLFSSHPFFTFSSHLSSVHLSGPVRGGKAWLVGITVTVPGSVCSSSVSPVPTLSPANTTSPVFTLPRGLFFNGAIFPQQACQMPAAAAERRKSARGERGLEGVEEGADGDRVVKRMESKGVKG